MRSVNLANFVISGNGSIADITISPDVALIGDLVGNEKHAKASHNL